MAKMNLDAICRCCISDGKILTSIWNCTEATGNLQIAVTLANCFNMQVQFNDGFPQNICEHCINQLSSLVAFKTLVENSRKVLTDYLESSLDTFCNFLDTKSEVSDQSYSDNIIDDKSCIGVYKQNNLSSDKLSIHTYSNHKKNEDDLTTKKRVTSKKRTPRQPLNVYFCTDCDSNFKDRKSLSLHCLKEHKTIRAIGKSCDYCYKKFDDARSLFIHKKKHFMPFTCEGCMKGFVHLSDLEDHLKTCGRLKLPTKNLEKKITEKVEYSVQTVKRSSAARKRAKASIINSEPRSKTICHHCGKSYFTSYIKFHMYIHSDDYKFKCELCDKSFKTRCNLNSHLSHNHHKVKKYKCQLCESTFITASGRGAHMRQVHLKQKNYQCTTCGKAFYSKSCLQRHMLCHSGEKNYTCNYCEKSYQRRNGLNVHLKNHHN